MTNPKPPREIKFRAWIPDEDSFDEEQDKAADISTRRAMELIDELYEGRSDWDLERIWKRREEQSK